ncbi:MAG: DnaJ domain-containing protein [Actinobacteria bacterium]|nr:DnaJ domain-containing protein [Actinomycetota bacterium]
MAIQQEWFEKDYYATLGVDKGASAKEVTKAYRGLARKLHPDANPGDDAAEAKFKEISAAYDVVGDEKKRSEYDEARRLGPMGGGFGNQGAGFQGGFPGGGQFDLSDLFGGDFGFGGNPGRSRRGTDLETTLSLPFREAVSGVTTTVSLAGGPERATTSRDVKVRIPPGVKHGQRIRLKGKGGPGNGGPAGDLFLVINVEPHPVFGRKDDHLTVTVRVPWWQAVRGAKITVPTLDGSAVTVKVPPGTPTGRTFRVKKRGVENGGRTGDLLATIEVDVPTDLTKEQKAAVEALEQAFSPTPSQPDDDVTG